MEAPQVGATSPTPGSMRCCNGSRTVGGVAPACETLPARWLPQDAAMTQSRGTLWTVGHSTRRSEEHTSELQSLMRISYAVFRLKKKKKSKPEQRSRKVTMRTREQR